MSVDPRPDPETRSAATPGTWAAAHRLFERVRRPVERFLHVQAASGIILIAAAAIALLWANSPWKGSYAALWHLSIGPHIGSLDLRAPLHFIVNDGLMVVFFLLVGLEVRREIHGGELATARRAALPFFAALGGMLAPAAIYAAINRHGPAQAGWGVPMATDIAFAVGILALLGSRVPAGLRILLLALAIVDDIGAIVVIAIFYSSGISLVGVAIAAGALVSVLLLQRLGARSPWAYVPSAIVLWAGLLEAGIHPTIGGVILGLMTPVRGSGQEATSPLVRVEATLHPWVAFGIMPVFALANAGVSFAGEGAAPGGSSVMIGVFAGLFFGKPIGVMLGCRGAVALGLASLPRRVTYRGIFVVGLVAGIGFTMAMFIANLAFSDASLLDAAKIGILLASTAAAMTALAVGRFVLRPPNPAEPDIGPHDAETSTDE